MTKDVTVLKEAPSTPFDENPRRTDAVASHLAQFFCDRSVPIRVKGVRTTNCGDNKSNRSGMIEERRAERVWSSGRPPRPRRWRGPHQIQ